MSTPITAAPASPHAQSLAQGTAGICLLQVERARRGSGTWAEAHAQLARCVHGLVADENASLYFGAPAVAFALHTAAVGTSRYGAALHALDTEITQLTRRRIDQAHARIDRGERPSLSEFDLFYGLTGLGTYLLGRDPDTRELRDVLTYLVRLTLPLDGDDEQLPGWWTPLGPTGRISAAFAGGHGNLGMAHGIAGVLALLSVAMRRGTVVDGQRQAITRICDWLDRQRQDSPTGPWWPSWITLADHRAGTVTATGPQRPSWCYGTPGLVRAQQLAGLATGDTDRQLMAERALLSCLADASQLALIRDAGLCHGAAGLLHTTHRVARDARAGGFAAHLPRLHALLLTQQPANESGLLDGTAGTALALLAADAHGSTASGWDACLVAG